jgi:hypothetical protein
MSSFTPVYGLLGGGLIGSSAGVLLLGAGHVLGASGLSNALFVHPRTTLTNSDAQWKAVLLTSFAITSKLIATYGDPYFLFDAVVATDGDLPVVSSLGYAVAGFLVGLGTKLGNGCTSGHGICGLARLSKRSLANVVTFMATGCLTASLCGAQCPAAQYLRASKSSIPLLFPTPVTKTISTAIIVLLAGAVIPALLRPVLTGNSTKSQQEIDEDVDKKRKFLPAMAAGSLFSGGLAVSGMIKSNKIFGFLDLTGFARGTWDPTLICVMGGGLVISLMSYQFVKGFGISEKVPSKLDKPLALKATSAKFEVPTSQVIDSDLIFGGAFFGFGWGIGGLCPGPALWLAAAGYRSVLAFWWPAFLVGSFVAEKLKVVKIKRS